jgi:predicted RNA-binding protein
MAYLEGKLRRETGSVESEHTGYVLEVEVDMSEVVEAEDLLGEQVALPGEVTLIDFPERGKMLVFKANSAAAIEDEEEDEEVK